MKEDRQSGLLGHRSLEEQELVAVWRDIVPREAKNSFRKLNAIVIQFFGGFLSLLLFMHMVRKAPWFESMLWGIAGYVSMYCVYLAFAVSVSLSVNRRIRELRANYFLPDDLRPNDIYPYTRKLYSVERNLVFDPENLELGVEAIMTMDVHSNIDNLPFIRHSMGTGDNKAVRFDNMELVPMYDEFRRSVGEIRFVRTKDTAVSQRWRMILAPGLRRGEEASYAVRWSYSGAKFLSFEEFSDARTRLQLPIDKEFDSFARSTPVPCERLITTVYFPVRYPIVDPTFSAKKAGHLIAKEIQRIRSGEYFRIEQPTSNTGWKLVLSIDRPIPPVSYIVQWRPPSLDSLVKTGLINEDQKHTIIRKLGAGQATRNRD